MIQKFHSAKEHGYRIYRSKRDDGICITLEFSNEEYHTYSEIIKEYRLFIDYNDENNDQKSLYFKDGVLKSGSIDYPIFLMIKKNLKEIPKKDRNSLEECLNSIDLSMNLQIPLETQVSA